MFITRVNDFFEQPSTEGCLSYFMFDKLGLAIMRCVPPVGQQFFFLQLYPRLEQAKTRTLEKLTESEMRSFARMTKKLGMGSIGLGAVGADQFDFAMPLHSVDQVIRFFEEQERVFGKLSYVPSVDWNSYRSLGFEEVVEQLCEPATGNFKDDFLKIIHSLVDLSEVERLMRKNLLPMLRAKLYSMCLPSFRPMLREGNLIHSVQINENNVLGFKAINILQWPILFDLATRWLEPPIPMICDDQTIFNTFSCEVIIYSKAMKGKYPFLFWNF